ncbi:MAG: hypothetical protein ACRDNK_15005 [Solirubrobacteraceae bacterium]
MDWLGTYGPRGGRKMLGRWPLIALVAALAALSPATAGAAKWSSRMFTASYDGSGSFNYSARGSSSDTGCFMNLGGGASYGFDQAWRVTVGFKSGGKGKLLTRIGSIVHTDGPQALGHVGAAHLKGTQTAAQGDCFNAKVDGPDVGTFDCTASAPTFTAWTNPQMEVSRVGGDLVVIARSFLDAHLKFTGTDTIPSDNGCSFYNDDWAFGSTMLPGSFTTAKVSLPATKLSRLGRGKSLIEKVGLGENTEHPPQQTCATLFGAPHLCIVNEVSLKANFRWGRDR